MSDAGVIHDIGYQRYEGPRLGRGALFGSLYVHGLRAAFGLGRPAKSKIFPWGVAGIVLLQWRSRRPLPTRIPAGDLALLSVATYKLSRLIAKDRITGFFRAPFTRYQGPSDRPSEV